MKNMKMTMVGLCAAVLCGCDVATTEPNRPCDALAKFWREADGRTVRRLPVGVLPENVFLSFGTRDFADEMKAFNRLLDEAFAKSTYNCITLTLRCNPELGDAETLAAAKACCARARREGVKVYMDTDPRIARAEFFAKWPDEKQSLVLVASAQPTNGTAAFQTIFKPVQDHMSWGSKNAYRPLDAKVASAFAIRRCADGSLDFSARRPVEVKADVSVSNWRSDCTMAKNAKLDPKDGYTDFSEVTVRGVATGLKADETLVATLVSTFYSIDVFSPNLIPFCREQMARYKAVGADGGMRDEWGFIPVYRPDNKTFFWSANFARSYAKDFGRDLLADFPLMAFGPKDDAARSAAIGAYIKATLRRHAEIERDFYETDKRLFGDDVYVCKHPTWISAICPSEYLHNGLDWWQASRDWAQGDETTPVYALGGMTKKFGGPVWMNEGYTATPERNAYRVWTYAMCGGRQVYHGLFGYGPHMAKYNAMPWEERRVRTAVDLLAGDNVTAQTRIRLLNLITRAPADAPVACVFGHEALVDWSAPTFNDHGRDQLLALYSNGWWADAYPASEFALGTFSVDAAGYLTVGQQRYLALATRNLRPSEATALAALTKGKTLKTRIFELDDTPAIISHLEKCGAVRQPLVKNQTAAGPFYPEPDGTLRLIDGTAIRVRADQKHLRGLKIDETLESNGARVSVAAEGIAAVRAKDGKVVALAAGGLTKAEGPGLSLKLDAPEDVVLLQIDGEWHGVWQTARPEQPVPAALQSLGRHWTKLVLPAQAQP